MKQLDNGLLALFHGLKSKALRKPDASLQANVGIPAGEAREYFLGGELLFRTSVSPVMVREHYEGGLLTIEFSPEPDPNAAMIARDDVLCGYWLRPTHGDAALPKDFSLFGKNTKPAITGLTTVHDGKVNGLGFCSDLGHE